MQLQQTLWSRGDQYVYNNDNLFSNIKYNFGLILKSDYFPTEVGIGQPYNDDLGSGGPWFDYRPSIQTSPRAHPPSYRMDARDKLARV